MTGVNVHLRIKSKAFDFGPAVIKEHATAVVVAKLITRQR
jgi:hypothetical protein